MKSHVYILVLLTILWSCKNNSESNEKVAEERINEVFADVEESLENQNIDDLYSDEDVVDEEVPEDPESASIFTSTETYAYLKKKDLSESELKSLEEIMNTDPDITGKKMITDNGEEYSLHLYNLKDHLDNTSDAFNTLKNIIELNVTPMSISKGYEITGRERIRALNNNPNGGFLEDMTEYYMFKGGSSGGTTLRRLGVASQENIIPILIEYFEVTEEELDWLKIFPKTEVISNSKEAKRAMDFKIPEEIKSYLKTGDCTEGFRYAVSIFEKRQFRDSGRFMNSAAKARTAFYELNPGWYGENEESGVTYIDFRRNYIFLPFGELSFADRVVSHDLGTPEGSNASGTLGEPEMALEIFRLGDPRIGNLGIKGVMTLEFSDNALTDVNGPDLYVFEMGKIEPTNLEISKDGENWISIGKIEGGTAMVDIAGFVNPGETFNYVRLTDLDTFSTVPGADVDAVAAIGGALRLNLDSSVLFDTGKYKLKPGAAESLDSLLEKIDEIPDGLIIVEGHTDNVGSPSSNLTLSKNRAKQVFLYLEEKLGGSYRFETNGFGETRPLAPNDTDENKQKNRRVEILVIPSY